MKAVHEWSGQTPKHSGHLSVQELEDGILRFIEQYNASAHPFKWTYKTDRLLYRRQVQDKICQMFRGIRVSHGFHHSTYCFQSYRIIEHFIHSFIY